MKAVVFHGVGDIRLDDVPEPAIQDPLDAVIRITSSAICGTDLHMVRGTMPGMEEGTILGHEAVGVVEEVGRNIRNLKQGDRVVVCSTISCGSCVYCRAGYHAQCDNANPNGALAGTSFFGGPGPTGPFNGLQAEYARIPYANVGLVKLDDGTEDEDAILISDIFPTGYFGAELAEIEEGDTVAVYGCGPVGQFAILSAQLLGAERVLAIDTFEDRLDMARNQGAETIDFNAEDPVETVRELTAGIGVDRVIDAVGVDAEAPDGDAGERDRREVEAAAPERDADGDWVPGSAPTRALDWAVRSVAKAGTISVIGVYPPTLRSFPIGEAMNRNLTINMGNCNHRKYVPKLVELVRSEAVLPRHVLTRQEPIADVMDAYRNFDQRHSGWTKVMLQP